MYRVGPTAAHVTSVQYRHTSFLRGLDSLDNEDDDTKSITHHRSLATKPRSLLTPTSLSFSSSPPIPPPQPQLTPDDGETSTTTTTASTTPMAAASIIDDGVSSIREGGLDDKKDEISRANHTDSLRSSPHMMDVKRHAKAWTEESRIAPPVVELGAVGVGSGDKASGVKANGEQNDDENARSRHASYEQDENGAGGGVNSSTDAKLARRSEGDRLPGIAHLDRHMPTPWSSSGGDGNVQQYRRATEYDDRSVPSRWAAPFSSIRRGESFGAEDSSSHHPAASRYAEHSPRHAYGQPFGPDPSSRMSSFAPSYTPYKRSGSPLQATRREREGSEGDANRRRFSYAHSASQQPVSPSSRHRSPHDRSDATAQPVRASEYPPSWQDASRQYPAMPPRGSYPPFAGPYDDRPTLPLLPARGGSVSGASRNDAYYSPPAPIHPGLDPRRAHGDSTSSSGSSGENPLSHPHHTGSYRAVGGMPRGSVSSLRSLSISYPYEGGSGRGVSVHEHAYDDGGYYDDMGPPPRHYGDQHHPASAHSSPRHHPYALHAAGGGVGSSSVDALAGGSPPSMPRRRGKLPKPVTDLLKTWLLDHAAHPYPTEDEKRRLCAATNLSISQVSNWFINARRRILIPQGSGQFGVGPGTSGVASVTVGTNAADGGGGGGSAMSTPHQSPGPAMRSGSHHHAHPYQPHDDRDPHQVYHHPSAAGSASAARNGQYGISSLSLPSSRNLAAAYGPSPPELPPPHYAAGGVHHQQNAYRPLHNAGRAPPAAHYRAHDYRYPRSTDNSPRITVAHDSP